MDSRHRYPPTTNVRRRRRAGALVAALAAGAALVGAAPAAVAAPAPGSAAPASPGHARSAVVVLTNADAGSTVEVSPGSYVVVDLMPTSDRFAWSAPTSDSSRVAPAVFSTTLGNGGALAVFRVAGRGTAQLQAVSSCRPTGQICPFLGILWRATVHSS